MPYNKRFFFRQMKIEDIPVYINEMFEILSGNMNEIAPTGNTFDEDFMSWSECVVTALQAGRRNIILIFSDEKLCGFFQYFVNDTTFRMDEIQFTKEYQGSGLFSELYRYLTTIIPPDTKFADAFSRKENKKSQGILKHLGLKESGESQNGNTLYFKGEYKTILKRYSK